MIRQNFIQHRIFCGSFVLILLAGYCACGDSATGGSGATRDSPHIDQRFSGEWNGSVKGDSAHFIGDPALTLTLVHEDTLVSGSFSTSDGAFSDATFTDGRVAGDSIFFRVVQTNIYSGARVNFSGKLSGNSINGRWFHARLHQGEWTAGNGTNN